MVNLGHMRTCTCVHVYDYCTHDKLYSASNVANLCLGGQFHVNVPDLYTVAIGGAAHRCRPRDTSCAIEQYMSTVLQAPFPDLSRDYVVYTLCENLGFGQS